MIKPLLFTLSFFIINGVFSQAKVPKMVCNDVLILVVDTSKNFKDIKASTNRLIKKFAFEMDTTKAYNKKKNLIHIANSPDPTLASKYTRKTIPDEKVSWEYLQCIPPTDQDSLAGVLQFLDDEVSGTTICLVAGIYPIQEKEKAEKRLTAIREEFPNAYFIQKIDLYCYWVY
jgi:hypothetical protein